MIGMKGIARASAAVLCMALIAFPAAAGPQLLFEVGTGKVLAHQDAFKRWYPASLTKLMTAYVAFRAVEAGELEFGSPIDISANAAKEPPSKMGYGTGAKLTLDNALKIIMVKSANDVATAIGETVGGSERLFAKRMNDEARRLGMKNSNFVNAHGLPTTEQYTTAYDMALLAHAIRRDYPQHAHYFSLEGIRAGNANMQNYNVLIGRFPGADGMKTGFICASGFNLIASATRDSRTMVAVVMGAVSPVERAEDAAGLLAKGFAMKNTSAAPTLGRFQPYGQDLDKPTDLRPVVCTGEARSVRWEARDADGRMVLRSPHVVPMNRPPNYVTVGLGGITGPPTTQPRYADVPIPTPRPDYVPTPTAAAGEG